MYAQVLIFSCCLQGRYNSCYSPKKKKRHDKGAKLISPKYTVSHFLVVIIIILNCKENIYLFFIEWIIRSSKTVKRKRFEAAQRLILKQRNDRSIFLRIHSNIKLEHRLKKN